MTHLGYYLSRYLDGKIPLKVFYGWFMVTSWDIHRTRARPSMLRRVYGIKLLFAEYTSGHRTEDELRELLKQYRHVTYKSKKKK